jgi:hypothetical protein
MAPLQYNQGCIKYFILNNADKNIFCMQTLGILCLNLITKQNSVYLQFKILDSYNFNIFVMNIILIIEKAVVYWNILHRFFTTL